MSRKIRFGDWIFEPEHHQLYHGGESQKLEPRVARLLECLLANSDKVLSHDELIDAVWDGRVVSDAAVRRGISVLRRTLSRHSEYQYIKTVPKKGYLTSFPPNLQALEPADQPIEPQVQQAARLLAWRRLALPVLLVLLTALLSWMMSTKRPTMAAAASDFPSVPNAACCDVQPGPLTCVQAASLPIGEAAAMNCDEPQTGEFERTSLCLPSSPSG